jgi:tetrapyrrole methylase family protein / MazG family protein
MSPSITIVGLGPGDPNLITREAWQVLQEADEIYLRTVHHPTVAGLSDQAKIHSFDALYEAHATFEEVYAAIARRVVELGARPQGVILAVPGHPLVGETATQRILGLAKERDLPVRIVAGISFLEPTVAALGVDPFDGLQICDATILAQQHHPNLDPDVGALVVQLYNRALAGEVKMTLMSLYHDDHPLRLVRGAGTANVRVDDLPLYALDRRDDLDHLTTVYIPPLAHAGSLASYQDVVARLRAPGGCPWDREQTHQTLRTHLIEESYEVLAALDADNPALLQEELGDLLLQILLHAQIANEGGDFKLIDSVQVAIEKLVRRHPHVFGTAQADTPDEVLRSWEQIKRAERGEEDFRSMLAGINKALPALAQALEVQRRVARVGFDWPGPEPVADKVREELEELAEAEAPEERVAEFGDLLFSLVNLARWHDIDAESALREANARFMRRFADLERQAAEAAVALEEMSLEQMDALWEEAKRNEG